MGSDSHFYNWIYGRSRPGTSVTLSFGDDTSTVVVDASGWWLRVEQDDDTSTALRRVD